MILSAIYANETHTAAVALTSDRGEVLFAAEHPDAWAELLASDVEISPYVPPENEE